MAQLSRVVSESQLSAHSSLEDEEIDLERERRRKEHKVGQHLPAKQSQGIAYSTEIVAMQQREDVKEGYDLATALKSFGGVAIAGTAWEPADFSERATSGTEAKAKTPESKQGKEKTVAMALEIAGGIAIAAAAWTPTTKLSKLSTGNNGKKPSQSLNGSTAKENKQTKGSESYSIARGLRVAGGVTIAASSWKQQSSVTAAQTSTQAGSKNSRTTEYSIAQALRTAGGVAIAGISGTGKLPPQLAKSTGQTSASSTRTVQSINLQSREERPGLIDMATSPIPAPATPVPATALQHQPPTARELTPQVATTSSPHVSAAAEKRLTPRISPNAVAPVIIAQANKPLTPTSVEKPAKPVTPQAASETPLSSSQVTAVTPRQSASKTPVVIKETIVRETSRPRSLRSREVAKPAALLLAANVPAQARPISSKQASIHKHKTPSPPPYSPATKTHHSTPTLPSSTTTIQVQEPTPTQTSAPVPTQVQPPEPVEVSANDIEEIVIPEEAPARVASLAAGGPKPRRKALAQLTPLERLTAQTRALR